MRLQAQDLSLAYGDVVALRNLTAEISGGVLGVLGATASGKTSLLQIIAGQIAPSSGELRIDGQVVQPTKRRDVAYVPQDAGAFPYFQRSKETMSLALSLKGIKASDYPDQFLDALVRERFRVLRLLDRLRTLAGIIFSTHRPEDAAAVWDEILILHRGRPVVCGTPSEITQMAVGHTFETSMPAQHLPQSKDWDVVSAERDGEQLHLRVVGAAPPGARPVAACLTDAYVLLTARSEAVPGAERQEPPAGTSR